MKRGVIIIDDPHSVSSPEQIEAARKVFRDLPARLDGVKPVVIMAKLHR